jgi:hypothetical protein
MNQTRTLHDLFNLHRNSARALSLWTKHLIQQGDTQTRWMHHTSTDSMVGSDRSLWGAAP